MLGCFGGAFATEDCTSRGEVVVGAMFVPLGFHVSAGAGCFVGSDGATKVALELGWCVGVVGAGFEVG